MHIVKHKAMHSYKSHKGWLYHIKTVRKMKVSKSKSMKTIKMQSV